MTEQLLDVPREAQPGAVDFRPIQYMGSKLRLLDLIHSTIDAVDPSARAVLDLFSGSGVVAARLSRDRPVTAVDIQEYARVLASALMRPSRMKPTAVSKLASDAAGAAEELGMAAIRPLLRCEHAAMEAFDDGDPEPLCEIIDAGSPVAFSLSEGAAKGRLENALSDVSAQLEALSGLVTLTRHYGGVYFGYRQALQLDCLLALVRGLPEGPQRDTGLAATLAAASESVSSVGNHFAQPVRSRDKHGRPKLTALATIARRRNRDIFAIFADHLHRYARLPGAAYAATAVCNDYRLFLASHREDVGVVYADPPYTRDHYSRFYHVLETIARGDEPDVSTVVIGGTRSLSRGLYRRDRHQSPFCIRSQAPEAFRELFGGVRRFNVPLIVSYSPYSCGTAARPQPRLLTIPKIAELASEMFCDVSIRSGGSVSHSKFNAQRFNGSVEREAELLLICRP